MFMYIIVKKHNIEDTLIQVRQASLFRISYLSLEMVRKESDFLKKLIIGRGVMSIWLLEVYSWKMFTEG